MEKVKKNRVLMVTPGGSFFADPFSRAFTKLGYECKNFDCRQGSAFTNRILKGIMNRLPILRFIKRVQVYKMNRLLLGLVHEYNPKYVFVQKGESIYPETIIKIKKSGAITVNFYNDMMNHWNVISKVAPVYDCFFSVDYVVLRRLWSELGLKNCFYLAGATEPMDDPFRNREYKYDISFIGTHNNRLYPNREKSLQAISDLDLHIWGNDSWADTPLKNHFHGRAYGEQRLDIYAQSRIVLDTTWDLMPTEFVASRTFEAMGCGAMYMTDCIKDAIKNTYTQDKEIVFFKDATELREKIIYYLKNDKEREEIARAGYARTVSENTFVSRVKQLLDTVENPARYLHK